MNRRDRDYMRGAAAVHHEYQTIYADNRDRGYTSPLGSRRPPLSADFTGPPAEQTVRCAVAEAGWVAGQMKLRADIDSRLAEVQP